MSFRYSFLLAPMNRRNDVRAAVVLAILGAGFAGGAGGCTGRVSTSALDPDPGRTPEDGRDGDGDGDGGGGGVPAEFICDESATPMPERMYKLTSAQFRNSVNDLVGTALRNVEAAAAVRTLIAPVLASLPRDERGLTPDDPHGRYRRLDQNIHQNEVDTQFAVAAEVGRRLTSNDHLPALLSPCVPDGGNNCVGALIDRLAPRVLGRPITTDERAFYLGLHGPGALDAAALADVLTTLFSAPQLVFRIEHGDGGDGDLAELSAWELARRLSLHLWQTLPDDELWQAAQDGSLLDADIYAGQVERLLGDERARVAAEAFIREWLRLDDLPSFAAVRSDARYQKFAAGAMPSDDLRDAIAQEAVAMVNHFLWEQPGSLADVLTTRKAFARSAELARLYDLPAWDGVGDPPVFDDPRRAGLLTRAAMLSTLTPKSSVHDARTRPIMKGVFIRRYLLCQEIPEPPANATNEGVDELRPDMGAREAVEVQTERIGACRGCHAVINPLGFVTEMFDSLGRARDEEVVWDEKGQELARWPIDSKITIAMVGDDELEVEDPAKLASLIVDSGAADACLARNVFRYTMARLEDLESDGCALRRIEQSLRGRAGSLRGMLAQTVLDPAFQSRSFR